MKKFRFSLQPVATLRNLQEMRASEAFAAANRELVRCADALERQKEKVAGFVESLLVRRTLGLPASMRASFMLAYQQELVAEKQAADAVDKAADAREQARQKWVDAHLQVKLVDKLRNKARQRHQAELQHAEQAQLDDRLPRGELFPQS
jgi:flagellar FliJ protein